MIPLPERQNRAYVMMAVTLARGLLIGYGKKDWSLGRELATSAGQLKLVRKAYDASQDGIDRTLFVGLAKKGDPNAEYWLAHMKDHGIATPQDVAATLPFYAKAAKPGNATAAARLGEIYLDVYKVPQDCDNARAYLEQAARLRNASTATELGRLYATGLEVAKDAKLAYAWFETAIIEGSCIGRHERDQLIADMPADIQKQAIDEARRHIAEMTTKSTPDPAVNAKTTDPARADPY